MSICVGYVHTMISMISVRSTPADRDIDVGAIMLRTRMGQGVTRKKTFLESNVIAYSKISGDTNPSE